MKKGKRGGKSVVFDQPEVSSGMVERNIDSPAPSGVSRITIFTSEEGGIDWEKTKAGADDELLNAITSDPTMLEKIAACPDFSDSESSDLSLVTNEEAGMVLDVVTSIEGMLFSRVSKKILGMKVAPAVIAENFTLTEKDHERQDPLAAQGLNMLQEFLKLDPKWRWLAFLAVAHGTALVRNVKNCVFEQYKKEDMEPENPATRNNIATPVQ